MKESQTFFCLTNSSIIKNFELARIIILLNEQEFVKLIQANLLKMIWNFRDKCERDASYFEYNLKSQTEKTVVFGALALYTIGTKNVIHLKMFDALFPFAFE